MTAWLQNSNFERSQPPLEFGISAFFIGWTHSPRILVTVNGTDIEGQLKTNKIKLRGKTQVPQTNHVITVAKVIKPIPHWYFLRVG